MRERPDTGEVEASRSKSCRLSRKCGGPVVSVAATRSPQLSRASTGSRRSYTRESTTPSESGDHRVRVGRCSV